ncbi:MAG: PilZ domain-containing protein [Deltaproteobacteria bacterium]|nr:PilZ domain-containing protein [Deltaproteobacteria bacterium]
MTKISKASLLRYRFGTPAELNEHFHQGEGGRTLFFFRDQHLNLPGATPVLLSISFTDSDQEVIVRGNVLARVEGTMPGLWLEFGDTRIARRVDEVGLASRKQKRIGCDVMIELRKYRQPYLGRLVDISLGGARLAGISGIDLNDQVEMRILSPSVDWPTELGRVEIVRTERNEVGARFLRNQSESRMAITRLFGAIQQSWSAAPEAQHPPMCCKGGALLEPKIPHIKSSRGGPV